MANKMSFSDMMSWANENSKSDFKNIFVKFSEGVHVGRILNVGHDPEYDNDIDRFFRSFRVHDMGQKSTFWSGLCLDYVMDNKQGIRKYLIQNKKLNKAEGEKIKTNGCVACVTLEALDKEYGLDRKELNNILRSKTRIIAPFFYLRQALPDPLDDRDKVKEGVVPTGLYVWEMSPSGLKKILQSLERFVKLEIGDDEIEEEELLKYFELESGLNIAVGAEGEGVGKNSREYTFEFKGKQGPLQYRNMPYGKNKSEVLTFDPQSYGVHELHKVEAEKFLTYQQMANKMLFLPGDGKDKLTELGKILQQVGYEIPGFEVSDNPLDDNYSQSFADKVLGEAKKKTLGINPVKNVHAEKARAKQKQKEEEENEPWEDEEVLKKEKKMVQSKKVVRVEEDEEEEETPKPKSKSNKSVDSKVGKSNKKVVEEEEEEDNFETIDEDEEELIEEIEDDEEEEEEEEEETPAQKRKKAADAKFIKAVPPSDEEDEEEEVRPKKKQQKRFY